MGAAALLGAGGGASGWLWTPLLARRGLVVLGTGKSGGLSIRSILMTDARQLEDIDSHSSTLCVKLK